jgi:DNA-binding NarL/FixJ family response regulator
MDNGVFVTVVTPSMRVEVTDAKVAAQIEKILFGGSVEAPKAGGDPLVGKVVVSSGRRPYRYQRKANSFKPWTPAEIDTLVAMHRSGKSLLQIASALGRSKQSVKNQVYDKVKRQKVGTQQKPATLDEAIDDDGEELIF